MTDRKFLNLEDIVLNNKNKLDKETNTSFFTNEHEFKHQLGQSIIDGNHYAVHKLISDWILEFGIDTVSEWSHVPIQSIKEIVNGENFSIDIFLKISRSIKSNVYLKDSA